MNWIALTVFGVALVIVMIAGLARRASSYPLDKAFATGNVEAYVHFVMKAPESRRPNLWDQGITRLWRGYRRETAMALMKAAAARSSAPVVQFWIRQALEIEPEMSAEHLDEEFLKEHFRPDVAARCGRVGCCG
jgi:hypothetical protein